MFLSILIRFIISNVNVNNLSCISLVTNWFCGSLISLILTLLFLFILCFWVKVPRLHCLIHRKLTVPDFLHSSPIMEVILYTLVSSYPYHRKLTANYTPFLIPLRCLIAINLLFSQPRPHVVKEIREALLRHLTAVLGDDSVAAHFMLLHLLSRVSGFLS